MSKPIYPSFKECLDKALKELRQVGEKQIPHKRIVPIGYIKGVKKVETIR